MGEGVGLSGRVVQSLLADRQDVRLVVTSGSMQPLLRPGDAVLVQPLSGHELAVGEIVLVQIGEKLYSHRVITLNLQEVHTKGDAVLRADAAFPLTRVLGVICTIDRRGTLVHLDSLSWQRTARFAAWIGRAEHRLWQALHSIRLRTKTQPGKELEDWPDPAQSPGGSLRNLLDVINWILRVPLRSLARAVVTLQLWMDH